MKDIKIKMAIPVRILDESSEFARMVNECAEYRKTHGNPTSIIKYEYMDDDKKWIGYKWYNFTMWVQNEKKTNSWQLPSTANYYKTLIIRVLIYIVRILEPISP